MDSFVVMLLAVSHMWYAQKSQTTIARKKQKTDSSVILFSIISITRTTSLLHTAALDQVGSSYSGKAQEHGPSDISGFASDWIVDLSQPLCP